MVSTFTPNIQLEIPARGDDVGTWDTPMGGDFSLVDLVVGGTATIPLAGAPVVLAAAQFQAKTIVFNSTLTASVTITFPTSFTKSYEIFNQTTGSSNFVITLQSTAAGAQAICCPPGELTEIANISGSMYYKNLGRVGHYWDHAGSSVPNWVSGCTTPPYLNCDGTTFSSATYPQLAVILGSTTRPDSRGRTRFALNQGTARISSAISGFSGNTVSSGGGSENYQSHSHANTLNDPGHAHGLPQSNAGTAFGGGNALFTNPNGVLLVAANATLSQNVTTGIGVVNALSGAGGSGNMPPAYIGGICMIRAG